MTAFAVENIVNLYLNRLNKIEDVIDSKQYNLKDPLHGKIIHIENQINFIEIQINRFEKSDWIGFIKKPVMW